jgi:hypothetical protein
VDGRLIGHEGRSLIEVHRNRPEEAMAARALKKAKRNANTSVAREALGGDGVEVPAALLAATATFRKRYSHVEPLMRRPKTETRRL